MDPGKTKAQDMIELGGYIRDIFKLNRESKNFRIFGPDESMSNRLYKVFEEQDRDWNAQLLDTDECLARDGRIMDGMLSEHMCEGWLEGYLLTGRHGFFASYEAFIRIVDSIAAQHAKWLKVCNQLSWRQPIASLNFILSSNVWQQDHNGFTHQVPGSYRQQKSRCGPHVPPAGYQLPVILLRPLHQEQELCQCHRGL